VAHTGASFHAGYYGHSHLSGGRATASKERIKHMWKTSFDRHKGCESIVSLVYTRRAGFTWWVTFVQLICFIVTMSVYGVAIYGGLTTTVEGQVSTGLVIWIFIIMPSPP